MHYHDGTGRRVLWKTLVSVALSLMALILAPRYSDPDHPLLKPS